MDYTRSMKKSVVVVEDDHGLRKQLVALFSSTTDIQCLYSVATAEEAIVQINKTPPEIVVMDLELPKMSGTECIQALKKNIPDLEIVVLTVCEDAESIFNAIKAGASGYLLKSEPAANIVKAVRNVHGGVAPLSGPIARKFIQHFQTNVHAPDVEQLSPRELEILKRLAAGAIYKEIAADLEIAVETVRTYIKRICKKLHVERRAEAVNKFLLHS
jgi:DNA-binding NarL/FixJ family response regulator